MEYMGKKLKDIIVTLPLEDGSELVCGVAASFDVRDRHYFALLPMLEDKKTLDYSQSYMLYRVEEDAEKNPVVLYIESDYEYALAANYFSENYLDKKNN